LISVRDNGPEISADFEPLTTSKRDGLGLGLSICETIAAAHGGRIWLEARTDATEFRVTVPFKSER
jgi:signal transduction histidine kinase